MPHSNFRILIAVTAFSLLLGSRTTLRDQVLLDALHRIRSQSIVSPSEESLFEMALHGATVGLEEYGDVYSEYIPPRNEKEFNAMINNRFEGIGIVYYRHPKSGEIRVRYPFFSSPARRAGVRAGDVILAVDGQSLDDLNFDQIAARIKGLPQTEVKLTIRHPGSEETVEVAIIRDAIQQPNVLGDTIEPDGSIRFLLASEPPIAYISLSSGFTDRTPIEMEAAIRSLPAHAEGLILDLRENPGGYVDACVAVCDMFVKPTAEYREIVSTRRGDKSVKMRHWATEETLFEKPMVVLIDQGSASASEILAACLQDFKRAKVVGTRSYGKGTVQELFPLAMHSGLLKLTDATYWRPSGKNINRFKGAAETDDWGVTPNEGCDVPVSMEQRAVAFMIRELRSHSPAEESDRAVADLLARVHEDLEMIKEEMREEEHADDVPAPETESERTTAAKGDKEKAAPFTPAGKAPYYDPQLDKAIEILTMKF